MFSLVYKVYIGTQTLILGVDPL